VRFSIGAGDKQSLAACAVGVGACFAAPVGGK